MLVVSVVEDMAWGGEGGAHESYTRLDFCALVTATQHVPLSAVRRTPYSARQCACAVCRRLS